MAQGRRKGCCPEDEAMSAMRHELEQDAMRHHVRRLSETLISLISDHSISGIVNGLFVTNVLSKSAKEKVV
jgi:hypothetical protein